MNTCRLCKNWDEPLFKYGVRHYVHAECGFKRWGAEFLDMIPEHQIQRLPYLQIPKDLRTEVERRYMAQERQA